MSEKKHGRWGILICATATLLFAGIIYAWSVIRSPITQIADTRGWSDGQITLNYTLTMCSFCIGGFLSGLAGKHIGMRPRMLIAAFLAGIGFTLTVFTETLGLFSLYVGYGIFAGTGIGIVYNVVIGYVNSLFPDKKGLCSGILMMGFGFSTLTLGKLMYTVINCPTLGWKTAYIGCGLSLFVVFLLFSFLLPGWKKETNIQRSQDCPGVTSAEMVRKPVFWKLFVFFILFAAVGSTAISGASSQFSKLGVNTEAAIVLAGILTVCNGVGRVISGLTFDRFGLRITQYVTSIVVLTATLLTFAGYRFSLSAIGCVGLCLCGFSYGFSPTLSAAFVLDFFGAKHFPLNFSILNLILIPASFVPTVLSNLQYDMLFLVLVLFSAAGFVLNLTIRKPNKTKE